MNFIDRSLAGAEVINFIIRCFGSGWHRNSLATIGARRFGQRLNNVRLQSTPLGHRDSVETKCSFEAFRDHSKLGSALEVNQKPNKRKTRPWSLPRKKATLISVAFDYNKKSVLKSRI